MWMEGVFPALRPMVIAKKKHLLYELSVLLSFSLLSFISDSYFENDNALDREMPEKYLDIKKEEESRGASLIHARLDGSNAN